MASEHVTSVMNQAEPLSDAQFLRDLAEKGFGTLFSNERTGELWAGGDEIIALRFTDTGRLFIQEQLLLIAATLDGAR